MCAKNRKSEKGPKEVAISGYYRNSEDRAGKNTGTE
jgi:hypothetical protein